MTISLYPSALADYAAPVDAPATTAGERLDSSAPDAPHAERRAHRAPGSPLTRITDAMLSLLAAAGVVCIIAVVCAFAFHITLIMFKTGSMSPTIPAGSLAIVREVPASEISVGDVTTIDRPGQMPVTHRVTSIEPATGGAYTVRMKGDANADEDPVPYTVTEVRKVLWSVDGVGMWVAKLQNPKTMAVTTVAMALLVTWAFWPRKRNDA